MRKQHSHHKNKTFIIGDFRVIKPWEPFTEEGAIKLGKLVKLKNVILVDDYKKEVYRAWNYFFFVASTFIFGLLLPLVPFFTATTFTLGLLAAWPIEDDDAERQQRACGDVGLAMAQGVALLL